ncbi:ABC transporter ATP-binding protein [Natrialba aegyptia]|uniref:ABC transporter ATP-binding protein n=1 Tax=Natrialba aegyptia DSM 13077 TaxID=1227491 RepID=M0AUB3_9EURY|nr:ABC transporter ATP-binding protein [Natrialba aegyptia]ELZ02145.1 ABC transporter ATP-binding protein [Natrialba aegyptia DSM 13077]
MDAITTNSLSRRFGDVNAVESLDLTVQTGEIYGFLGPNGAGKSTTINMLLGFTPPSTGSGTVLGSDLEHESVAVRQSIGVLPEDFGVYGRLTARKHVRFAIETKGANDDPDDLLARVELADVADRTAGGFSTGMKQRLALAMALAGSPDLLILDEPSSGLDPNGAREMRAIIREENERGTTVFFSSHVMEQVEAICDRVGIMRDGRLIAEDAIDSLKDRFDADSRLVVTLDTVADDIVPTLETMNGVTDVNVDGNDVSVVVADASRKAPVIEAVGASGVTIEDIRIDDSSLEDLFATLTTGERPTSRHAEENAANTTQLIREADQ